MTTCDCHECSMEGDGQIIKQLAQMELIMRDIFLSMVATNPT